MALLSNLKLVSAKRATHSSPELQRRQKLITKIDEQILLAQAALNGTIYQPTKFKHVVNVETGERHYQQVTKKVRNWWWKNDAGKVNLVVRYGARILELAAGKIVLNLKTKQQ